MKTIDKKDQPKLIVIVSMAVALFGFAGWQAVAAMAGTPETPPVAADGTPAAGAIGRGASAKGKTAGAVNTADFAPEKSLGDVFVGKDPFLPSGPVAPKDLIATALAPAPPRVVTPVAASPALRNPSMGAILRPFLPSATALAKIRQQRGIAGLLDGQNPIGAAGASSALPQPVVVPPPPPPVYTMTGIIMGDAGDGGSPQPIAVLRGQATGGAGAASDDRRFVRVGDSVGNGYVVASINRAGIILRLKGDKRAKPARIPLGGLPNAAMASAANSGSSTAPTGGRTSAPNAPIVPEGSGAPSAPVATPATAASGGGVAAP